jgi:uncharacterized protein
MTAPPLWNKQTQCPFCSFKFETTRMRSSAIRVIDKETDLGTLYEGEIPFFYDVTACPQCTFAAQNKDFDTIRMQAEPKILEASKKLRERPHPQDLFVLGTLTPELTAKKHELALAFLKMRSYKNLVVEAGLTLHLVWIFRHMKDVEREKAALARAATAYQELFDKGTNLPENLGEPGVLYLIGELHRRQGLLREGHRFFERSLASKEISSFPRFADMSRDRMTDIKEQLTKEGV